MIAAADAVLTVSGTAALECFLAHRPMVVTYRMAAVSYLVARLLVRVPYFSLPNLLAGRRLVPEFLQGEVRAERLGPELLRLLNGGKERRSSSWKVSWPRSSARSAMMPAARPRTRCSGCSDAEWVLRRIAPA